MRLIVTSQKDIAGSNIYELLASGFGFEEDREFEGKPIYKKGDVWLIATERGQVGAEHLDDFFAPDYYVFASRHRSESGERTLTVHVTGNLTEKAEVGGRPKELAYANSDAMKVALIELERGRKEGSLDYKVSMEATHHGPTGLKKPVLFVEVGSTEVEWRDEKAVGVVARAALMAAENKEEFTRAIGIGGNHYAPVHTKAVLLSDIAIGHIIPTYAINEIELKEFSKAVEKTGAEFGFLDWKGMRKEHKDRVRGFAEELGLPLKRGKDIMKAPRHPEFEIEAEFFNEAVKANRKIVNDAIIERGGVPQSSKNGLLSNKISAKGDIRKDVISACIKALQQKYAVQYDGRLILKEEKLDPKKAEKLGIKPGPILGKIMRGETVEVNGKEIKKDMVVTEEIKTLEIKEKLTKDVINADL
jgi:D-aminoacyl-tRNA deacylase